MDQFSRTRRLIGDAGLAALGRAHVALFGLGGVGGQVAETLIRCGVGALDFFDGDVVTLTNLNRQLIATHDTLGMAKVDAMRARLASIAPEARLRGERLFYTPQNADSVDLSVYDYIVDAVDTVAAKLTLAERAQALGVPIISAMGAGNRLDPTRIVITDIYATRDCPLARVMRRELRRRGVKSLKVACSTEPPIPPKSPPEEPQAPGAPRRDTPASAPLVPPAMGIAIAWQVVRDLMEGE